MLTAEERAASRASAGAGASTAGRSRTGGGSNNAGVGPQRQGGEAIPMDNMAVPDGDGGWVEPPPPYVVDPKPAYHP